MVTPIKQGDERWGRFPIGNSATTIASDGCTISCCCMALEKLRGWFASPAKAAYHWTFNKRGEILWLKTHFNGMKFIERGYSFNSNKIKDYAQDDKKAAILEVNHGAHWVYVVSVNSGGLRDIAIIDPIDGVYYDQLPSKYKPTGYALFQKDEESMPAWMKEFYDKALSKGMTPSDPLTDAKISTIEDILFEMGIISKKESKITVGRFLVILEKIKENW